MKLEKIEELKKELEFLATPYNEVVTADKLLEHLKRLMHEMEESSVDFSVSNKNSIVKRWMV